MHVSCRLSSALSFQIGGDICIHPYNAAAWVLRTLARYAFVVAGLGPSDGPLEHCAKLASLRDLYPKDKRDGFAQAAAHARAKFYSPDT